MRRWWKQKLKSWGLGIAALLGRRGCQHSGSLKPLIEGAIAEALRSTEAGIQRTEQRLREFEDKYQLSTAEFLHRYENDEFQETLELDEWIGELRMLQCLQEKAERLRGIEFVNWRLFSTDSNNYRNLFSNKIFYARLWKARYLWRIYSSRN